MSSTSTSSSLSFDDNDCVVLDEVSTPELVHQTTYTEEDSQPTFRHVACSLAHDFDILTETSLFDMKSPVFVAQKMPSIQVEVVTKPIVSSPKASSPLSPSSYSAVIDVPIKLQPDAFSFTCMNPSFTSYETPVKIMSSLKSALDSLFPSTCCEYNELNPWSISVQCLVVAEVVSFLINLYQCKESSATIEYEVEFIHQMGEQLVFNELIESIRSHCSDMDTNGCPYLYESTMDTWFDIQKPLCGRKYAINDTEAKTLMEELNCTHLHIDTLYEVAKCIKNHCRHQGNRKLFMIHHKKEFLKGLEWMLTDTDIIARFALFILLQYANDTDTTCLFTTAYEKSSFQLLLNQLVLRNSLFTSTMAQTVLHSTLFV